MNLEVAFYQCHSPCTRPAHETKRQNGTCAGSLCTAHTLECWITWLIMTAPVASVDTNTLKELYCGGDGSTTSPCPIVQRALYEDTHRSTSVLGLRVLYNMRIPLDPISIAVQSCKIWPIVALFQEMTWAPLLKTTDQPCTLRQVVCVMIPWQERLRISNGDTFCRCQRK